MKNNTHYEIDEEDFNKWNLLLSEISQKRINKINGMKDNEKLIAELIFNFSKCLNDEKEYHQFNLNTAVNFLLHLSSKGFFVWEEMLSYFKSKTKEQSLNYYDYTLFLELTRRENKQIDENLLNFLEKSFSKKIEAQSLLDIHLQLAEFMPKDDNKILKAITKTQHAFGEINKIFPNQFKYSVQLRIKNYFENTKYEPHVKQYCKDCEDNDYLKEVNSVEFTIELFMNKILRAYQIEENQKKYVESFSKKLFDEIKNTKEYTINGKKINLLKVLVNYNFNNAEGRFPLQLTCNFSNEEERDVFKKELKNNLHIFFKKLPEIELDNGQLFNYCQKLHLENELINTLQINENKNSLKIKI